MVKDIAPSASTFHFWNDGCAGQFRSQYDFRSFSYYPKENTLTCSYGEPHHFKGTYDGIGRTIKRKVHTEVLSAKVVIENAKQFTKSADRLCDIAVIYLDAKKC